jgi:RNA polymerase sigma factor (sigma-70 family)
MVAPLTRCIRTGASGPDRLSLTVNPAFDIEQQLQRHGSALRRLAGELVRDPGAADDAVQEVWTAALQQGPRHAGSVGGWLRTVLVHAVARLRRGERRRVVHEAVSGALRGDVAEDHAIVLARQELAERLLTMLRSLDAPYGDVVWQRYFEDRTPAAIAAASGVPVATVKSRLQRGLGMLRERLGKDGDGGDWRGAFVAAFGLRESVAAPAAVVVMTGGVLVTTAMKWGTVAAAAILVAAFVWWPKPDGVLPGAPGSSQGASLVAAATNTNDRAAANESTQLGATDARREVRATSPTTSPPLATVRGRAVDDAGNPIAGAVLEVNGSWANVTRMEAWLKEHDQTEQVQVRSSPAGSDGRFALEFASPPPFQFFLSVHGDGFASMRGSLPEIAVGRVVDLGDVVMSPGVLVRGRVVDQTGLPIADAQIDVHIRRSDDRDGPFRPSSYFAARTDPRGAFTLPGLLVVGSYRLQLSDGFEVQAPDPIELVAARRTEDVVVVATRLEVPMITGKVLDQDDQPVRAVTVAWGPRADTLVDGGKSKADGSFELRCKQSDPKVPVRIAAGGEGIERAAVDGDVAWGTRDLVVRVFRPGELEVRVLDASGEPIAKCRANVEPRNQLAWGNAGKASSAPSVGGAIRFGGLVRGAYYAVVQFDRSTDQLPIVAAFEFDGRAQRVEVRVGTTRTRLLRVQHPDGSPVAGSRVQLCEMLGNTFDSDCFVAARGEWFMPNGLPRVLVVAEFTTGHDGTLSLRGPRDRVMGLRVVGSAHTPVERADLAFDTAAELVVTVDAGARFCGTIVPDGVMAELRRLARTAGAPFPESCRPMLRLRRDSQPPELVPTQRQPPSERAAFVVRGDGTFDVSGLPAGRWRAEIEYWYVNEWAAMSRVFDFGAVELQSGKTLTVKADLQRLLPGTVEGLVLRNAVPCAKAAFSIQGMYGVRPDGRPDTESTRIDTDAEGRFRFIGRAGRYAVISSNEGMRLRSDARVDVVRGSIARQTFEFSTGKLALRVIAPNGAPVQAIGIHIEPGLGQVTTNLDGNATSEVPAATPLTLRVLPKRLDSAEVRQQLMRDAAAAGGGDPFAAHWLVVGTTTVKAGEATTLEVRLPPEWAK